jgi:hypothetical protein
MTEHDGAIPCTEKINVQLRDVMEPEETLTPRTNHCCIGQLPCPGLSIDVPARGMGGGDAPRNVRYWG